MDAEKKPTDWPLADVKRRLGTEINDVVFFILVHALTLPFFAKAFSGHSNRDLKHSIEAIIDLMSMFFEPQGHTEIEIVLLRANRAHASLGIPPDQILAALATLAVATYDWLKGNTTIPFGDREEHDLLNGLAEVGSLMNIQKTPETVSACRDVFSSSSSTCYCPVARQLLIKGMWAYWKVQGFGRVPFALIIFPASVPSNLHVVFGIPRLPARFYRFIQTMLRVRWGTHNWFNANRLAK